MNINVNIDGGGIIMAKIITFGIQKGGAAKTTTTGITAYLLNREGYRVLCVDLDSQGNLTELMTLTDVQEFRGQTVLEALQELDPKPYIIALNDKLHLLPAEDLMATFSRWLYTEYRGSTPPAYILKQTLTHVEDNYDFILIDTPPALGDITMNALVASDFVVPLFESSKFCYSAIRRFLDTVGEVQVAATENNIAISIFLLAVALIVLASKRIFWKKIESLNNLLLMIKELPRQLLLLLHKIVVFVHMSPTPWPLG
jgi:chromosome partitioning protein